MIITAKRPVADDFQLSGIHDRSCIWSVYLERTDLEALREMSDS